MKKLIATTVLSTYISLLYSPVTFAQDNNQLALNTLNLNTVYTAALGYDATFAASKASLNAVLEKPIQAKAILKPTVNATASANANYGKLFNSEIQGSFYATGIGLSVNYPLYRPALKEIVSQADLAVRLVQAQFANTQQDLILRTAQAYIDVLFAHNTMDNIAAQKTAIAEQLKQAQREFKVGTKTILDTNEAQARFDAMLAQEAIAKGDEWAKRTALSILTGIPPESLSHLTPLRTSAAIDVHLMPTETIESWVNRAKEANIGVQIALLNRDLAQIEIKRNHLNKIKPTVDMVGSLALSRNVRSITSNAMNSIGVGSVGVQLNYPLYSGGGLESKEREAIALYTKSLFDVEVAQRQVEQATRQTYLGLTYGIAQIKALESAEKSTQTLLKSTKLGYEVGVRINLDVLNAQQAVENTKTQALKARYDVLMGGLRLKALAHQLSSADLNALNKEMF